MAPPQVFTPSRSKYLILTTQIIVPILTIFGALTLLYFLFFSPFFDIKNIQCELDFEPCQNTNILAELTKLNGSNIFLVDISGVSTKLTSADFTLRSLDYKKQLPNTLIFSLQSVYPTVALKVKNLDHFVAFDHKLKVIKEMTQDPNVPVLTVLTEQKLILGQPLEDPVLKQALLVTITIFKELNNVVSLELVDQFRLDLKLHNGVVVILSLEKDLNTQIRTLQALLAEATISKDIQTIDVRFLQPVLR